MRIILCPDREVEALNRRYRHRHGPTDVLTFVYDLVRGSRCEVRNATSNIEHGTSNRTGDIVIALGVARRQARQHGVSLRHELLRLGVHGLAHLAGYDHHTVPDFCTMRKKEFEALIEIL